jgi:hypothetical protein
MNPAGSPAARKTVYALFITVAAAAVAGRLLSAERIYEPSIPAVPWPAARPTPTPMFSSNDRSRWATVRNLVHKGDYSIGRREILDPKTGAYQDSGVIFQDDYWSVDKVLDEETLKFYSSKPPFLATVLAGEYWVLNQLGLSIDDHPFVVVIVILFTVQWLPVVIYLVLLSRLLERFGTTDWGRYFVLAAACFATLVTSFAISLNNHTISTCCVLFAFYPLVKAWERATQNAEDQTAVGTTFFPPLEPLRREVFLSGLFAGLAVCVELPALAVAAVLFVFLVKRAPGRTLAYFVPAAAVPVVAYFLTNYLAVGQLVPVQAQFESSWYKYDGSHWLKPPPDTDKPGIDWARLKETRAEYAFHVFLGHHGLFSLSPIYLLAFAGMVLGVLRRNKARANGGGNGENGAGSKSPFPFFLYPLALSLSVVVIGFYLVKTTNYGGWSSGLRWLMWLTPFWLLTLLPVADRLAQNRWGRGLAYAFLAVSVMSVNYRSWNPWRLPWLYNLLEALGLGGY